MQVKEHLKYTGIICFKILYCICADINNIFKTYLKVNILNITKDDDILHIKSQYFFRCKILV